MPEPSRRPRSVPPPPVASRPRDEAGSAAPTPQDTDDTLAAHLGDLARRPLAISLTATAAIAAFVAGTIAAGPGIGALAALGAVALAGAVVYGLASSRAEEEFFAAYAEARRLQRLPKGRLPPSTPLLRKGDAREAEQIMSGTLPGGLAGALALYTYEEHSTDSEGRRTVDYHRFTVVVHDLPELARRVSELHCQRRSGFRFLDSAEDVFRRMRRLELESEALDKRYEIFFGDGDEEGWLKQLFAPSFIVWLAEGAPEDLAFELSAGALCVSATGHHESADALDQLCEAAGVIARRLSSEAAE